MTSYRASWLELVLPAVDAVRHLVLAVEGLVSEHVLAVRADEALRMPSLVEGVQDRPGSEGLGTLGTDSARHVLDCLPSRSNRIFIKKRAS